MKTLTTHLAAAIAGALIGSAGLAYAQLGAPLQAGSLYRLAPGDTVSVICQSAARPRITAPSGTVQPMALGPMAQFTGLAVSCAP